MTRNLTLDISKILLAFMVIGIHGEFLTNFNPSINFLTKNGIFRIAVPTFFIINGYYFVSISNKEKLFGWVKKLLIIYACWMLFYIPSWFPRESLSLFEIVKTIKIIVVGYHHLWYLLGTIGAGIITFYFRNNLRNGITLAVICFILGVIIQYIGNYHFLTNPILDKLSNMNFIHRNFLFLGFPFFYLGYIIRKEKYFNYYSNIKLLFIFFLGLGLLLSESFYNYKNPLNDGGFDNYFSLILVAPSLFLLISRSQITTTNQKITLISTVIYLIHPFWFNILNEFLTPIDTWNTVYCIVLSFLSSYILVHIHKKIRFIL